MTSLTAAIRDREAEWADRRPARQPATWSEIWSSSWGGAGLDTPFGLGAVTEEAWSELEAAVIETTGKSAAELTGNWRGRGTDYALPLTDMADMVAAELGNLPKDQRERLAPLADLRKRAAEKALAIETAAAETAGATYGLSGTALGWIAGIARVAADPVNLASMPIGGPLKGPVIGMLGREAAIGAAVEAVQQPAVQAARAGLGLDHGFGRAVETVGMAALGQAGFAGLLRGGAAAVRRATGRPASAREPAAGAEPRPEAVDAATAAPGAGTEAFRGGPASHMSPEDFEAAAMVAEREAAIRAETRRAPAAAPERIDLAARELEAGRPRSPEEPVAMRAAERPLGADEIVRPDGGRLTVTARVMELSDLTVSHDLEGNLNPAYPGELQPRDRSAAPSRTWVAERAKTLEPLRLGRAPTAQEGAPIVGPDGIVESGNGRAMLIARAYDRHPERADAYRAFLEQEGFDTAGMKFPVLVRVREPAGGFDRAAFAREANVATTAGLSASERAFADAKGLDEAMLGLWRGETDSAGNIRFVRTFAERIVAAEERPNFVSAENRLSAEGRNRIEAALVARGWGERDIVQALYETAEPTSRAILGAMADTAPAAARLKAAIAEGRVPADADPTPAIVAAFRLVERARSTRQKMADILDQIDIEHGTVADDVAAAVRMFFRDDTLRQAAARDTVAVRIDRAIGTALDRQNAVGDLFGETVDAGMALRGARRAGEPADELPVGGTPAGDTPPPPSLRDGPPPPLRRGGEEPRPAPEVARPPGDPELRADATRAIAEAGDDFEVFVPVDDTAPGGDAMVRRRARDVMTEAEEDAAATRQLLDCIGRTSLPDGD